VAGVLSRIRAFRIGTALYVAVCIMWHACVGLKLHKVHSEADDLKEVGKKFDTHTFVRNLLL
jgi:hypothetical protein